jgi:hypothetical protein
MPPSQLENLPKEVMALILKRLMGASSSDVRTKEYTWFLDNEPACNKSIVTQYSLHTSVLGCNRAIHDLSRDVLNRDHLVVVEIDCGEIFWPWNIGIFPMIIVPEPEVARLPETIAHIRFTFPQMDHSWYGSSEVETECYDCLKLTILVQEKDLEALARYIHIIDLAFYPRINDGSISTEALLLGTHIEARRGYHGLRIVVNIDPDASEKRVRPLLECVKSFKGPLNELTISGFTSFSEVTHMEKTIPELSNFTYWEILSLRAWLKHQSDLCILREDFVNVTNISDLSFYLYHNWRKIDYTPQSGRRGPHYQSGEFSRFRRLSQASRALNFMIMSIKGRRWLRPEITLNWLKIGTTIMTTHCTPMKL